MKLEDLCHDLVMCEPQHVIHLKNLLLKLNPIEAIYIEEFREPWKVTSGYRTAADQVRIYNEINAKRKLAKKRPLATPMRSQHMSGNAIDVYDPKGQVKHFIAEHLHLFEDSQIYFEAFQSTPNWVHMQSVAPASGNRFFAP